MPARVGGQPNPLVSLGRLGSSSLNGNLVLMGDDYENYQASIKRMQMPRCWRVFSRRAGARFEIAADVARAHELMDVMDVQQQARMRKLGSPFVLNDETHGKFYREVARRGLAEGYAVISALVCDEGVVATALGVRHGATTPRRACAATPRSPPSRPKQCARSEASRSQGSFDHRNRCAIVASARRATWTIVRQNIARSMHS